MNKNQHHFINKIVGPLARPCHFISFQILFSSRYGSFDVTAFYE